MHNCYAGLCYRCQKLVEPGQGRFERHNETWRWIHELCIADELREKADRKDDSHA